MTHYYAVVNLYDSVREVHRKQANITEQKRESDKTAKSVFAAVQEESSHGSDLTVGCQSSWYPLSNFCFFKFFHTGTLMKSTSYAEKMVFKNAWFNKKIGTLVDLIEKHECH